ncbi:MAG: hypothetical protein JO287_18490 [Pseudonocardiales bacterium]|nr:hypothetical protein [Pseudonocardiales bacterium]
MPLELFGRNVCVQVAQLLQRRVVDRPRLVVHRSNRPEALGRISAAES